MSSNPTACPVLVANIRFIVCRVQLYSSTFANIFNDVTEGDNPGCGTRGFPAAPGWDPVTGLGTVNFPRMLSRFMALP